MKIAEIIYTPQFIKNWKRVPKQIQQKAVTKEKLFKDDCFHATLKTHKLKGELNFLWSFSVDFHWRIVFYLDGNKAVFTTIGTHRVYQ